MLTLLFILVAEPFPSLNLEDYDIFEDNWVMFYHLPGSAQYHSTVSYLDVYALNGDLQRAHIRVPTALTMRTIDYSEELLFLNRDTMKCEPFGKYLPTQ